MSTPAGRFELAKLVHRLGGGFHDVEEAFVGADFELIHRFFVNVGRAVDCESLDACGKWDRAGELWIPCA
jgi:hypothetical protein